MVEYIVSLVLSAIINYGFFMYGKRVQARHDEILFKRAKRSAYNQGAEDVRKIAQKLYDNTTKDKYTSYIERTLREVQDD